MGGLLALGAALGAAAETPRLPRRIDKIVLHTLGGPDYGYPGRRWTFLSPAGTFALWKRPRFGAHWIVWTDGTLWPRHAPPAGPPGYPAGEPGSPLTVELAARLVREATPVYSHVEGANSRSVGIELAHSGRAAEPFPAAQQRALVWLVEALLDLSDGRLGPADVLGHKDLDRRPAYVGDRCRPRRCLAFVDADGRPYRRRVDPPESLFGVLRAHGIDVPRAAFDRDLELQRAEAVPAGRVPRQAAAAPSATHARGASRHRATMPDRE